MTSTTDVPTAEPPTRRFHLTPGHCLLALLAVEGLLFLSQWFRWLPKGWPVLIAMAVVGLAVLGMVAWFGVAMVFRRRFQFSVRSLMMLVIVVALPCSWLGVEKKNASRQKAAVKVFDASDCFVWRDDQTDDIGNWDSDKVRANARQTRTHVRGTRLLTDLLGQDFFHAVTTIEHATESFQVIPDKVDDSGYFHSHISFRSSEDYPEEILLALKDLPDVRKLDLSGMPVGDSDLEAIVHLRELRQLNLADTRVTDAGVAKLQKALPNCKITH